MEKKLLVVVFALFMISIPLDVMGIFCPKEENIYYNMSIMTFGSAHNFKVNGFHRYCWGKGNDSYVYLVYYGPSILPVKCKIWNESIEKWINVRGEGLEIHNFSGWIFYVEGVIQPYTIFIYGKCDELITFHVR